MEIINREEGTGVFSSSGIMKVIRMFDLKSLDRVLLRAVLVHYLGYYFKMRPPKGAPT